LAPRPCVRGGSPGEPRAARQRGRPARRVGACVRRSPPRQGDQIHLRPAPPCAEGGRSMKIGLFTVLFNDKPLEEVADYAAGLGYEMVKLGTDHIIKTARVASELEVPVVNGFFGSTVWESWYIWPPQRLAIYEQGWDLFVERWNPILDEFAKLGVRFAHEVHPTEIAYN